MVRLLSLLDTPQDIAVLAPLIQREILYRLLMGNEAGSYVRSPVLAAIASVSPRQWDG